MMSDINKLIEKLDIKDEKPPILIEEFKLTPEEIAENFKQFIDNALIFDSPLGEIVENESGKHVCYGTEIYSERTKAEVYRRYKKSIKRTIEKCVSAEYDSDLRDEIIKKLDKEYKDKFKQLIKGQAVISTVSASKTAKIQDKLKDNKNYTTYISKLSYEYDESENKVAYRARLTRDSFYTTANTSLDCLVSDIGSKFSYTTGCVGTVQWMKKPTELVHITPNGCLRPIELHIKRKVYIIDNKNIYIVKKVCDSDKETIDNIHYMKDIMAYKVHNKEDFEKYIEPVINYIGYLRNSMAPFGLCKTIKIDTQKGIVMKNEEEKDTKKVAKKTTAKKTTAKTATKTTTKATKTKAKAEETVEKEEKPKKATKKVTTKAEKEPKETKAKTTAKAEKESKETKAKTTTKATKTVKTTKKPAEDKVETAETEKEPVKKAKKTEKKDTTAEKADTAETKKEPTAKKSTAKGLGKLVKKTEKKDTKTAKKETTTKAKKDTKTAKKDTKKK